MVIFGIVILLVVSLQIVNKSILQQPTTSPTMSSSNYTLDTTSHIPLAFFLRIYGHYYTDNLKVFVKNLKNGDYLLIRGKPTEALTVIQKVADARPMFDSRVHVNSAIFYYSIGDIIRTISKLPPGIDFIVYDYEKGDNYSPEFTTNESKSIQYFDQAKAAVLQYNKKTDGDAKLMVTPPVGELSSANWNWSLVAKHMDVMDMQLQAFVQDRKTMQHYVLETFDKTESSSPTIFIQISITKTRGTIQDNVDAINTIKDSRIGAFLIWYQSTQTSDLEQFFSMMSRK